jgi:multiple sugar transport system ATP-binding protein
MVFQNYALYPHMSVYDNMAFGLKLARMPRPEIDERVREAARILGLDELLRRKPAALSGGQRQRVAMGRAIVRHPQAFLMDEPLSNLDAKLRVQTRAEIARLQHDLGVTTIYVTHDQVEAMTMGDRVAVMRKGILQQVDTPQALYEKPVNLFVAGFIGSPAMNLVEARLARADGGGLAVELGASSLPLPPEVVAERPGLAAFVDRMIILGIRPEDMEDASLVSDAPTERRIASTVELREALGSDVLVHFTLDAPPAATEHVVELAVDAGREGGEAEQQVAGATTSNIIARLNPRTTARTGDSIELDIDTARLHFFDPDGGMAIYDAAPQPVAAEPTDA